MTEAKITDGPIFRAINKAGRIAAHGFSPKVIWGVVKQACKPAISVMWPPMTFVGRALGFAMSVVANWSRSSSCSGT